MRYLHFTHAIGFFIIGAVFTVAGIINLSGENAAKAKEVLVIGVAFLCTGGIILIVSIIGKRYKARRQHEEEKVREKLQEEARLQRNKKNYDLMIGLGNAALNLFGLTPGYLREAGQDLDQAETYFKDNAFAPFWDSIEKAAKALGHFSENIQKIEGLSFKYTEVVGIYEGHPPDFPLSHKSVEKLKIGNMTAERMQSIVRKAQQNFQFAMIYEQRKTNQISVAGSMSLAQALDQMTQSITTAIESLVFSVDSISSSVSNSIRRIESQLDDIWKEQAIVSMSELVVKKKQ